MDHNTSRKIAPVITKRRLSDPSNDTDYWRSLPPQERINALEEIREEYHSWKKDVQPGFQRVYRIIKRK